MFRKKYQWATNFTEENSIEIFKQNIQLIQIISI